MAERTVQMIGYGRTEAVPLSQIEQHKRYGWRYAVAETMTKTEILKMPKDDLNDFAARELPHLDLDPEQMNKQTMQDRILQELNL